MPYATDNLNAGFNITDLEPTWDVKAEEMTLMNY